jgi:hypothetical protein
MVEGSPSAYGLGMDFGVLTAILVVFVGIASRLYPTVVT